MLSDKATLRVSLKFLKRKAFYRGKALPTHHIHRATELVFSELNNLYMDNNPKYSCRDCRFLFKLLRSRIKYYYQKNRLFFVFIQPETTSIALIDKHTPITDLKLAKCFGQRTRVFFSLKGSIYMLILFTIWFKRNVSHSKCTSSIGLSSV